MARRWHERLRGDEPILPVPRPASDADALTLLSEGKVLSCDLVPWGSNYTFLAALSRDNEPEALGVYKPRRGEAPLWDFPDGTLYRRERAAYLVCGALQWDFVPLTIIRDGPHGIGSMQLFVETTERHGATRFDERHQAELARIALFDLVTNNADRKGGHCLLGVEGRVWGIDHGLTFHCQPKLRTVLWEFYQGDIPTDALDALRRLLEDQARRDLLAAQLKELLAREEVKAFFTRAEHLVDTGHYSGLGGGRARAWPFF